MNKTELVNHLNDVVNDLSGTLIKLDFIRLKDDLTSKENKVIDNFYNKVTHEKTKVENFQKKIDDATEEVVDDSVRPILMIMKIDAKSCHTSALRAIKHFYPD